MRTWQMAKPKSQRRSYTWEGFNQMAKFYEIPKQRITEQCSTSPWKLPEAGARLIEEPGARKPHAGDCGGGGWVTRCPTSTTSCKERQPAID